MNRQRSEAPDGSGSAPKANWLAWVTAHRWAVIASVAMLSLTALIEGWLGRSPLGPDGKFGWWDGNIWSSENSQRVADAYSFSHIAHGILFFGLLWLVARRLPVSYRFLIAVLLEAGWEVLENSPLIINRYREATIALGYVGTDESDTAIRFLELAYAQRSQALTFLKHDPLYDRIRSDPRVIDLIARVGFPPSPARQSRSHQ